MNDITQASDPEINSPAPSRRGLLLAAGAIAAAGGAGLAWWRSPPSGVETEPFPGFWSYQWDTPQGETLRLQDFRGKRLLINFWATWCPPCIEELPLLNDFFRRHRASGWQVIGLAIDRPAAVQGFLKKMPLEFPIGLAGATGSDVGKQLGNPSGALPYSVALSSAGGVAERKLGQLHAEDLAAWAQLK